MTSPIFSSNRPYSPAYSMTSPSFSSNRPYSPTNSVTSPSLNNTSYSTLPRYHPTRYVVSFCPVHLILYLFCLVQTIPQRHQRFHVNIIFPLVYLLLQPLFDILGYTPTSPASPPPSSLYSPSNPSYSKCYFLLY